MRRKIFAFNVISSNESKWLKKMCASMLRAKPDYIVVNLTQFDDDSETLFKKYIPEDILIFVKNKWEKSFSLARNQALDVTPKDVDTVMYLDCDELILEESYSAIEGILCNPATALHLVTIYNSLEVSSLAASLFYPRIFPLMQDGKPIEPRPNFSGTVHNQLNMDKQIPTVRSPVAISHAGYALSKDEMAVKHARSEELLRAQIEEDPNNFFSHLNLAQLLRAKGEFGNTEYHALRVLEIIQPSLDKGEERYLHAQLMALDQLATALLALGRAKEAIPHIEAALEIKPDYLDSLMCLANCYLEQKEFQKAEFWYKRYLFIRSRYDIMKDSTNVILNHLNSSFIARYNLGVIYGITNQYEKAAEEFKRAYEEEFSFRDVFIKYIHALRLLNKHELVQSETNKFMTDHPKLAAMVYDYFGDLAVDESNIELAKFNYYQAANLAHSYERADVVKLKWDNIKEIFGDLSQDFFDTSQVSKDIAERVTK